MAEYHAFPCGKLNQSFRMENEHNQILYEANLVKYRLLAPSDYDFINHVTHTITFHKVGKTKSVSEGNRYVSFTTASCFSLDGKNCFDALKEKGYTMQLLAKPKLLHPEFGLFDTSGKQTAVYKMNVVGEKEEDVSAIGNKQSNTVITTESDDLDAVFLGAFILSRVDFSLCLV